jgi:polyphosphate kinase
MHADGTYTRDKAAFRPDAFSAHTYFMTNPSLSGRGRKMADKKAASTKRD